MRRTRWVLSCLLMLSFAIVVAVSVCSYRGALGFSGTTMHTPGLALSFERGEVWFYIWNPSDQPGFHWEFSAYAPNPLATGFRFRFTRGIVARNNFLSAGILPSWSIAIVLLALRWAIGVKKRRRIPGTCFHCGYDLRATPECCPECGVKPEKPRQRGREALAAALLKRMPREYRA